MANILHILNGDNLSARLQKLQYSGDFVIWREMLCEGPTTSNLLNDRFINKRKNFLKEEYNITSNDYETKFISQLEKLKASSPYDEIILWFEFDLFCHINMMSCLRFLKKLKRKESISLVCSGRVSNEKQLKGLSELSDNQLKQHYTHRVQLQEKDIDLAHLIWSYYSKGRLRKLKPEMAKDSNFKYLSNCLRAHKERFPDSITGLNTLEMTTLKLIDNERITSKHQLCGYILTHQGFYGFGDMQIFKMIDRLAPFYTEDNSLIILNKEGKQALNKEYNFYNLMKDQTRYGGNLKYGHVFDAAKNKLIKTKM